jgi:hypothetical protein
VRDLWSHRDSPQAKASYAVTITETLPGSDILHLIGGGGGLGIVSYRQSKTIHFLLVTDATTLINYIALKSKSVSNTSASLFKRENRALRNWRQREDGCILLAVAIDHLLRAEKWQKVSFARSFRMHCHRDAILRSLNGVYTPA